MKHVHELHVGWVVAEVVLDDSVDAALDEDVVVAGNQAHLQRARAQRASKRLHVRAGTCGGTEDMQAFAAAAAGECKLLILEIENEKDSISCSRPLFPAFCRSSASVVRDAPSPACTSKAAPFE
eukprot:812399-Pelagomonas_calceolata.AAC.1